MNKDERQAIEDEEQAEYLRNYQKGKGGECGPKALSVFIIIVFTLLSLWILGGA